MNNRRRSSLFNRWKQQNKNEEFEGITEDEMIEYKEAFHLFDKVGIIFYLSSFLKILHSYIRRNFML